MATEIQMIKRHSGRKIARQCLAGIYTGLNNIYDIYSYNNYRPSPKKDVKNAQKSKTTANTSFQDFQDSVRDAWDLDDDEFCTISGKNVILIRHYLIQ